MYTTAGYLNLEETKNILLALEEDTGKLITYIAIDPGKGNGICGYDTDYKPQFMLTLHEKDIVAFLRLFQNIEFCIMENYRVRPVKYSHEGSDIETLRVMGRIEGWAARNRISLIKQMPNVKSTGYKWIGKSPLPRSNMMNHALDAHVHFMYWAVRTGRIPAEKLVEMLSDGD